MGKKDSKVKLAKAVSFSSDEEKGEVKSRSEIMSSDDDEEANEDLSLKIVQKFLQRSSDNNTRDDGVSVVVTYLKDEKTKKEKTKCKKISGTEGSESAVVDNVKDEGKLQSDKAIEISDKSVETNPDEVPDNIVLRNLLRGPRYFDPPDKSWGACYNCGEEGHTAVNCTSAKRKKPCFVCGSFEHNAKQCSKGRDCYICKQQGHRAKDCPEKNQSSKICLKCGNLGHDMFFCRNNYCPDDLKEIQCCICQKFGHLCCVNYRDSGSRELSCYRCGLSGHTGLACTVSRRDTNCPGSANSCYKCGGEGHFARECTSSSKVSLVSCSVSRRDTNCPVSANSCYKCGGEGHFARECTSSSKACTRFHGDTNSPGSAISCYKCGGEGHFARECTSSSTVSLVSCSVSRRDTNCPVSANSCYKCGGEGHFAHECTSSSKACTRFHGNTNSPGSAISCYKCGGEGHFARECTSSTKANKRNREMSTPKVRSSKKNRDRVEVKHTPYDLGKTHKKKKARYEEFTSAPQTKHRGGWITEDPGDFHSSKAKSNNWRSPSTPSNRGSKIYGSKSNYTSNSDYTTSSHSSKKPRRLKFTDSASNGSTQYYPHKFSASRYGQSSNDWKGRNYTQW